MCTFVGHSLAGGSIALSQHSLGNRIRWTTLFAIVLISNLPDVDLLFGYVVGNPNRYHHFWTHSLVFALLVGLLFGFGYWGFKRKAGIRTGCIVFSIVLSHVALDFFTKDTSSPYGIQLFWPISREFFISPISLFRDVSKASTSRAFLGSLFCWHNLWTVLFELAIFGPVLIWIGFRQRLRKRGELE